MDKSSDTTLIMSDNPESAGALVGMFQTDTVAFKTLVYANWENQRPGGVAVITGADYSPVS